MWGEVLGHFYLSCAANVPLTSKNALPNFSFCAGCVDTFSATTDVCIWLFLTLVKVPVFTVLQHRCVVMKKMLVFTEY